MQCPKCGTELETGSYKCTDCDWTWEETEGVKTTIKYCGKCGKKNDKSAPLCKECGFKFSTDENFFSIKTHSLIAVFLQIISIICFFCISTKFLYSTSDKPESYDVLSKNITEALVKTNYFPVFLIILIVLTFAILTLFFHAILNYPLKLHIFIMFCTSVILFLIANIIFLTTVKDDIVSLFLNNVNVTDCGNKIFREDGITFFKFSNSFAILHLIWFSFRVICEFKYNNQKITPITYNPN